MEYLNIITLRGIVGGISKAHRVDRECANFSVMTEWAFRNIRGEEVVDVQWTNAVALEKEGISKETLQRLERGCFVELTGRLRTRTNVSGNGVERSISEVIVSKLDIIEA